MQRAAQLVEPARIPAHERVALVVAQFGRAQRVHRVAAEAVAERGILLQPVEQHVDVVAAQWSHASAARSMRPIWPKKGPRARAEGSGATKQLTQNGTSGVIARSPCSTVSGDRNA